MRIAKALSCAALLGAALAAPAQPVKIGFVDTLRVERESVQGRRMQEALKKEFEPREKQVAELQRQLEVDRARFEKEREKLPAAEQRSRENALALRVARANQMLEALAEDIDRRVAEIKVRFVEDADTAVKAVAEAGGYDLILTQAVYRSRAIDITDQVLKEMAKRAGAAR
jgi:outer membrane protein